MTTTEKTATNPRARTHARFDKPCRVTTTDGATIAWGMLGEGNEKTPVLLGNGWSCPDTYWLYVAPALVGAGHPVIVMDNRGHGESTLPRQPNLRAHNIKDHEIDPRRMAEDYIEVLDAAGVDRAVIVGHSLGVQNLFEAYKIAPERIAGLVPIAGTCENPVKTFADTPQLDALAPIGWLIFRNLPLGLVGPLIRPISHPWLGHKVLRAIKAAGPGAEVDEIAPHVRQFSTLHVGVLMRMMATMQRHSAADVLPEIDVPVLVVAGTRDTFTPCKVQESIALRIPGAELRIFEDAGHMLPIEVDLELPQAVVDFLERRVESTPAAA